ncbi:MAG: pyruvate dehydrogenase complex dihydrolipoamide acetyltransferase [Verrucomicrobiota bacterium]
MAIFIEMPKLSDTMTEGTLLVWHKKPGDEVSVGDVIADVETDKATMEMTAFDDGILGKHYVQEGDKAPLGAILAVLVEEGEDPPEAPPAAAAPPAEAKPAATETPKPASTPAQPDSTAAPVVAAKTSSGRVKASPLARKIAAAKGVNIAAIMGTGPGGRIIKRDVENAEAGAPATASGGPSIAAIRPNTAFDPDVKRIPLSGMRSVIADRLLTSKSTIPHFYLNVDLDAEPLMKLRKQVNESSEASGGVKFTVNDFVLKATVLAAVDTPEVNASFDGDAIVQFSTVNLAIAIAVPDGLVTPVIRDAQKKTLKEISESVKDFAVRAKSKKLSPDEFADGTITVSNLGAYGVDSFDAIINPPQSSILSVGAIAKKPVVKGDEIVPGLRMWVGMSCDHRVIDGAVGATYLQAFRKYIENPELMLV